MRDGDAAFSLQKTRLAFTKAYRTSEPLRQAVMRESRGTQRREGGGYSIVVLQSVL